MNTSAHGAIDNDFATKVNNLRDQISAMKESVSENLSQYQSEVALFGDAGPGQHPSLWLSDLEKDIADFESELKTLLCTPDGEALLNKEAMEIEEFKAELYAGITPV